MFKNLIGPMAAAFAMFSSGMAAAQDEQEAAPPERETCDARAIFTLSKTF